MTDRSQSLGASFAVVDDLPLIREGLVRLPGVRCAGTYSTVPELLAEAPSADVVLLDMKLRNARER